MPPRKRAATGPTPVDAVTHRDKRVNLPTADAQDFITDDLRAPIPLRYPRDTTLDPQLVWTGKDEQDADDLVVEAPPLYIQEKVDPRVLIENLRRSAARPEEEPELTLFETFDGVEGWQSIEYYKHAANWSNRMILGDSLPVMASLAERENLRGQVQMIYLDPPYGIKFGSNWQANTSSRDVTDGKIADATREVEQIKAFRDTWELGINSYLAYLRDRLVLARELLTDSGSLFVQIGDDNVHLVRALLDEIFGAENFVSAITFLKTSSSTSMFGGIADYVLWVAKSKDIAKFRRLYRGKAPGSAGGSGYTRVRLADGTVRPLTRQEATGSQDPPAGARIFAADNLTSQSMGRAKGEGAASWFTVTVNRREYNPGAKARWKTNEAGMRRLQLAGRVAATSGKNLAYVRYLDDFPAMELPSVWTDTLGQNQFGGDKIYVVQTALSVVARCILMTTDPGDLVLDPTCGSGTTAFVAEQWGRRWITIDTSRVALTLARQRIMGAKVPALPAHRLARGGGEGSRAHRNAAVRIAYRQ